MKVTATQTPFHPLIEFKRALGEERISGLLLIITTGIALWWINSPWADSYHILKETHLQLSVGAWGIDHTLHHWVNDGLMAIFFLLVGLEIKREVTEGVLAHPRHAFMTVAAALGGVIVPASIFLAFNFGGEGWRGWGVPMATDIAFVIGLLGLLGDRVPAPLKVFLVALAVVDDLAAVLIIALFYTQELNVLSLLYASGILAIAWLYGHYNGRSLLIFMIFGVLVWYFMYASGVHATLAGVLLALVIPTRSGLDTDELTRWTSIWLRKHASDDDPDKPAARLREVVDSTESPASRLEEAIRPWVLLLVMPLFALLNAGVEFSAETKLWTDISLGVIAGLLIGKPVGILAACLLVRSLGVGHLPEGVSWRGLIGLALLAGIGFTMALFIGGLAFSGSNLLAEAKTGILIASLIAAVVGLTWLRLVLPDPKKAAEAA